MNVACSFNAQFLHELVFDCFKCCLSSCHPANSVYFIQWHPCLHSIQFFLAAVALQCIINFALLFNLKRLIYCENDRRYKCDRSSRRRRIELNGNCVVTIWNWPPKNDTHLFHGVLAMLLEDDILLMRMFQAHSDPILRLCCDKEAIIFYCH